MGCFSVKKRWVASVRPDNGGVGAIRSTCAFASPRKTISMSSNLVSRGAVMDTVPETMSMVE